MEPGVPGSSPGGGTIFETSTEGSIFKSSHARYAAHTAQVLGYAFASHDPDGYLFEIRDGRRRAMFSAASGTPYALNAAHAYTIARDKAFQQAVLEEAGVEAIPSRLFFTHEDHLSLRSPGRERVDALAFAARASFPIFAKPVDGARGAFAEIVSNAAQFERYLQRVAAKHYAILVQPYIAAPEARILVLHGEPLCWYRKTPPRVVGDGRSTLGALAECGLETLAGLDDSGRCYTVEDTPAAGVRITLAGAVNRARGGGAAELGTDPPAPLAALAVRAAAALSLQLAAVDVFARADGPIIIEVNANPSIQSLEEGGRWDLIETIWRANFEAAFK